MRISDWSSDVCSSDLIREGDRLRFKSLMETYSRTRRETATTRIVEHRSVIPNLVDFFDTRTGSTSVRQSVSADRAKIAETYGLNPNQADAFVDLLDIRDRKRVVQGKSVSGRVDLDG